jgi:hypothetical protein
MRPSYSGEFAKFLLAREELERGNVFVGVSTLSLA